MLWDKEIVVRSGAGYRDNVLLSSEQVMGRPFFTVGLDLSILRFPLDGWQVGFAVTGDDIRYFRPAAGVNGEDLALVSLQVQKYFGGHWRFGCQTKYTYTDQVLQEVVGSGGVQAVQAQGSTFVMAPFVRRDLGTNWWIQFGLPVSRDWWQSPLDDYWKYGAEVVLGCAYARHSQVVLTMGAFYISHDSWLARDNTGGEIPGEKLDVWSELVELKWGHPWDQAGRWTSALKIGFSHDEDTASGYFDYDRLFGLAELRFHTSAWEIKASSTLAGYYFPVQTAVTIDNPHLLLATVDSSIRAERLLFRGLHVFASFEHEQAFSNDPTSEFRNNVVSGGVSWAF